VWYRMWAIGVLAFPVLLLFVDWFFAFFLSGCVMGAYGVLLPLVYAGRWSRDAEGDKVWLPTDSQSNEPPAPPHAPEETEESDTLVRSFIGMLFPLFVVAVLVYTAIETVVRK
jgi:hypothetical protein